MFVGGGGGMVQAWVAHIVSSLKRRHDKSDWWVTSQKLHKNIIYLINIAAMLLELLAPLATWIWWTHAAWGVGGLAHVLLWGLRQRDLIKSNDQGFTRSHWTPTLGNYSLRIAPAATRATYNKTTMQNVPTLQVVSMTIAMWRYNTVRITQRRRFVAFIKATTRHHRASTHSNSINQTHQRQLLLLFHCEKGLAFTCWPLITIGVWHIKVMRSFWGG